MVVYIGPDLEHKCSDLRPFTEYKFRLRASNRGAPNRTLLCVVRC